MGGTQSKKCNSSTQTPFLGYRYTTCNESLRRCSTFTSSSQPVSASSAISAAARVWKDTPVQSPLSKRPKYDPVYVLWKNSFEDQKTRTPRKVSPIKGKSPRSLNMPDAVAGQLTPEGFPSYTDLEPSMSRKKETSCEDMEESPVINIRRRPLRRVKFFDEISTVQPIQHKDIIANYGTTLSKDNGCPREEMDVEPSTSRMKDPSCKNMEEKSTTNIRRQSMRRPKFFDETMSDEQATGQPIQRKDVIANYRTTLRNDNDYPEDEMDEAETSETDEEMAFEGPFWKLKHKSHLFGSRSVSPSSSPTPERHSPDLLQNLSYDTRMNYYYL